MDRADFRKGMYGILKLVDGFSNKQKADIVDMYEKTIYNIQNDYVFPEDILIKIHHDLDRAIMDNDILRLFLGKRISIIYKNEIFQFYPKIWCPSNIKNRLKRDLNTHFFNFDNIKTTKFYEELWLKNQIDDLSHINGNININNGKYEILLDFEPIIYSIAIHRKFVDTCELSFKPDTCIDKTRHAHNIYSYETKYCHLISDKKDTGNSTSKNKTCQYISSDNKIIIDKDDSEIISFQILYKDRQEEWDVLKIANFKIM